MKTAHVNIIVRMQKTPVPCTITYKGRELISRGATLIEAALKRHFHFYS